MKYSTSEDNRLANIEIERWKMKNLGVNPISHYISNVVSEILNRIPREVIIDTGVDYYIIEDVITQNPDDFMNKNVYDFYEEHVDESIAAEFFGRVLEEYMLG